MLVLSRKVNETIVVDGNVRITVTGIRGQHVRVAFEAPRCVPIYREELLDEPQDGPEQARPAPRPCS